MNDYRIRKTLTASMIAISLSLSACGGGTAPVSKVEETPRSVVTLAPSPEPTPTPLPYTSLFTGAALEEERLERPIAVMVNNFAAARPQSGLTEADVIWEVLAEGGITRLVAIFQSSTAITETIGPVRSNRPYLIDIADSYGAIMAHAGASQGGYAILQRQKKPYLDEISNAGAFYWRSKERKAPHNLYTNLEKLRQGRDKRGYHNDAPQVAYLFHEAGTAPTYLQAVEAKQFSFIFTLKNYRVGYEYDEATSLYKRFINDEPHTDKNNEQQLVASNLIVMNANHQTLDGEGRLEIDLTSGGKAILIQKGKAMEVEWLRAADEMIRWTKDGEEIKLLPGKTIVHIVPKRSELLEHIAGINFVKE
ncbi:DUF3048 domain-containing protein [Paenibacillus yanchengensis]|uniref:DUF3048 domain-containing protein n=1 Tax=Paenibacillus yanchengensis TaxID=2035833 RepID=A0ABW4YFC0_9BACL